MIPMGKGQKLQQGKKKKKKKGLPPQTTKQVERSRRPGGKRRPEWRMGRGGFKEKEKGSSGGGSDKQGAPKDSRRWEKSTVSDDRRIDVNDWEADGKIPGIKGWDKQA